MLRSPHAVEVPEADRAELAAWTRSATITAGAALRARIVLKAGAGEGTSAIAGQLGVSRPTVIIWRERYRSGGIAALAANSPPSPAVGARCRSSTSSSTAL